MDSNNLRRDNMVGRRTHNNQKKGTGNRSLTATCEPAFVTCCPSGGLSCDCRTLPYDLWQRLLLGTEVRRLHEHHCGPVVDRCWCIKQSVARNIHSGEPLGSRLEETRGKLLPQVHATYQSYPCIVNLHLSEVWSAYMYTWSPACCNMLCA